MTVEPRTLRRVFLVSLLPAVGVLMLAGAGALALRAFSHNSSLACSGPFGASTTGCSHYSYAPAVVLGVAAVLLVRSAVSSPALGTAGPDLPGTTSHPRPGPDG